MSELNRIVGFNQGTKTFIKEEQQLDLCHDETPIKYESESHGDIDCNEKCETKSSFQKNKLETLDSQENVGTKFNTSAKCDCFHEDSNARFDLKPDIDNIVKTEVDDHSHSNKAGWHVSEKNSSKIIINKSDRIAGFNQGTDTFIKEEPQLDLCHDETPIKYESEFLGDIDCNEKCVHQAAENMSSLLNLDIIKHESLEGSSLVSSYVDQDFETKSSFQENELETLDSQENVGTKFDTSAKCDCFHEDSNASFDLKPDIDNIVKTEVGDHSHSSMAGWHVSEDNSSNIIIKDEHHLTDNNKGFNLGINSHMFGAKQALLSESSSNVHSPNDQQNKANIFIKNVQYSGAPSFQCLECSKCFTRKFDLKRHELIHKKGLKDHGKIHKGLRNFKCLECSKCFTTKSNLKSHEIRHKKGLKDHDRIHKGLKTFKCLKCSICFMDKSTLILHENIHKGLKPFQCLESSEATLQCLECSKCFSRKSDLKRHELIHKKGLKDHDNIHKGLRNFKCLECSKCFTAKSTLRVHENTHKGLKPFQCLECSKCFTQKSGLTKHETIHKGLKPFQCLKCSKCFANKYNLMYHERTHKDLRPFKCFECSKCFTRKSSLIRHENIHKGLKTFTCVECSKCFVDKYTLRVHENIHKGLKTFQCLECSKCFTQKSGLTRHENIHKGLKPFQCLECSKCFTQKSQLKKHARIHKI